MNDQKKDKIFCEVGIDIGFITKEDVAKALENQKVDEAIGVAKPIGAYLLEAGKLNKEQIGKIVVLQEKLLAPSLEQPEKNTAAPLSSVQPSTTASTLYAFGFIVSCPVILNLFVANKLTNAAYIPALALLYSFFGCREKGWFKNVGLVGYFCTWFFLVIVGMILGTQIFDPAGKMRAESDAREKLMKENVQEIKSLARTVRQGQEAETTSVPRTNTTTPSLVQGQPKLKLIEAAFEAPLEFDGVKIDGGFITVIGRVQNISGEPIERAKVSCQFFTSTDVFVKADTGQMEYEPILPNQVSPFKVIIQKNPEIKKFKISFITSRGIPIPSIINSPEDPKNVEPSATINKQEPLKMPTQTFTMANTQAIVASQEHIVGIASTTEFAPGNFYDAIINNDIEEIKKHLKSGVDLNSRMGESQKSVLHLAIQNELSDLELVKILIEAGANVNATDSSGVAPLALAAYYGTIDIAKLLIEKGADIHVRDMENKNALHYAIAGTGRPMGIDDGKYAVAEFLILNGVDRNLKNNKGETPFDIACKENRQGVFEDLAIEPTDFVVPTAVMEIGEVIAPSGAIVRDSPSRTGKKLTTLPRATRVTIISKDGPVETIEKMTKSWYKISCQNMEGWAFGGFIEIKTN